MVVEVICAYMATFNRPSIQLVKDQRERRDHLLGDQETKILQLVGAA